MLDVKLKTASSAHVQRTLFQAGYEDVSQLPTAAEWEQILKCGEERNYRKVTPDRFFPPPSFAARRLTETVG